MIFFTIFLIVNIRSSFTHVHGFQLLVLLPLFIEIIFFVCTNRINLVDLKSSSAKQKVAKGFLKLSNLYMLKNPKKVDHLSESWLSGLLMNCCVLNKGKLLYLLYSMARKCCLMHLIKQNCLLNTFLRTLILMAHVSLYLFYFLELI